MKKEWLLVKDHYTVNVFLEELQSVYISYYEPFCCIDAKYTDFLNKLMKNVTEIATR